MIKSLTLRGRGPRSFVLRYVFEYSVTFALFFFFFLLFVSKHILTNVSAFTFISVFSVFQPKVFWCLFKYVWFIGYGGPRRGPGGSAIILPEQFPFFSVFFHPYIAVQCLVEISCSFHVNCADPPRRIRSSYQCFRSRNIINSAGEPGEGKGREDVHGQRRKDTKGSDSLYHFRSFTVTSGYANIVLFMSLTGWDSM